MCFPDKGVMVARPFDWRDLPTLHAYRNECVFLDSALVLTRGPLMMPGALLSFMAPEIGIFTAVAPDGEAEGAPLVGQAMHHLGSAVAHLTFMGPASDLETDRVTQLLEYLTVTLGERSALRLLAEVDDNTRAFESLRKANFAIYARQRIWQLTTQHQRSTSNMAWRRANGRDAFAIRMLYNNLVPGLVQQVEPYVVQKPRGLVYQRAGDLLGYVDLKFGHRGIWLQPFVHPEAEDALDWLVDLIRNMPYRNGRPIYICLRSYQAWLESAIEDLGAEAGPRQAVMVKHLALSQKVARNLAIPNLEGGRPEISAPITHLEIK